MEQISQDKSLIRQYLLGELPEAELRRIEELFILNPDYREQVLITEDELVEDYLDGALTEQERRKFTTYFLAAPQQREKLRIASSLKRYVDRESRDDPPRADEQPTRNGHRKSGHWLNWRNPLAVLPMAAVVLLAIVFGAGKLLEMRQLSRLHEQEQSRRAAIERELAVVNGPAGVGGGRGFAVALSPVTVRGAQGPSSFAPPADAALAELQLILVGEKYPSYNVLLQRVGEPAPFTIHNLRAESTPDGQAVVVRVPAHLLTRGDYQLQLLGVDAKGATAQSGHYAFQVTERPAT